MKFSPHTIIIEMGGVVDDNYASLILEGAQQGFFPDAHPSSYQPHPTGNNTEILADPKRAVFWITIGTLVEKTALLGSARILRERSWHCKNKHWASLRHLLLGTQSKLPAVTGAVESCIIRTIILYLISRLVNGSHGLMWTYYTNGNTIQQMK